MPYYDGDDSEFQCNCPECQDDAEAYGEYSLEDREDNLRNALARMTDQEKDALRTVLADNRVICVGSWATTGEKQSYTCLMGTVGAELLGITHDEWVDKYMNEGGSMLISDTLSSDALRVPGPFDDLFGTSTDEGGLHDSHTVRAVGDNSSRPYLLNARGRQVVWEMLV